MNNFEIAEVLMKLEATADRFMGVYSSDNLPERIESGDCLIFDSQHGPVLCQRQTLDFDV